MPNKIIVPVLPSDIDIHACSRCIRDLLLVAKIRRDETASASSPTASAAITLTYQALIRFPAHPGDPDRRDHPGLAETTCAPPSLASACTEMKSYLAQEDVAAMGWPLVKWLARPAGAAPAPPGTSSQDAGKAVGDGEPGSGGGSQAVAVAGGVPRPLINA